MAGVAVLGSGQLRLTVPVAMTLWTLGVPALSYLGLAYRTVHVLVVTLLGAARLPRRFYVGRRLMSLNVDLLLSTTLESLRLVLRHTMECCVSLGRLKNPGAIMTRLLWRVVLRLRFALNWSYDGVCLLPKSRLVGLSSPGLCRILYGWMDDYDLRLMVLGLGCRMDALAGLLLDVPGTALTHIRLALSRRCNCLLATAIFLPLNTLLFNVIHWLMLAENLALVGNKVAPLGLITLLIA